MPDPTRTHRPTRPAPALRGAPSSEHADAGHDLSNEDAIDLFLTRTRHTKTGSDHTARAYRADLRDLSAFLVRRRLSLAQVTHAEASRYLADLAGRVAPRTVQRRVSCIRSLYRFLRSIDVLQSSPFEALDLPSFDVRSETHKVLTDVQFDRFVGLLASDVTAARAHMDAARQGADRTRAFRHYFNAARRRAVFSLASLGGLRTAEILNLVVSAFEQTPAGFSISFEGKGSKRRTVPLAGALFPALVDWLTVRREVPTTTTTLFITLEGKPVQPNQMRRDARKLGNRVGLPFPLGPHTLRRTFATRALAATGDLRGVGDLLGHASVLTTQIYTHVDHSSLRAIAEASASRGTPSVPSS